MLLPELLIVYKKSSSRTTLKNTVKQTLRKWRKHASWKLISIILMAYTISDISRWLQCRDRVGVYQSGYGYNMERRYEEVAAVLRAIGDQLDRDLALKFGAVFQNAVGQAQDRPDCGHTAYLWTRRWSRHIVGIPEQFHHNWFRNRIHFDLFFTCLCYHIAGTVRLEADRVRNSSQSTPSTCSHIGRTLTVIALSCYSVALRLLRAVFTWRWDMFY